MLAAAAKSTPEQEVKCRGDGRGRRVLWKIKVSVNEIAAEIEKLKTASALEKYITAIR